LESKIAESYDIGIKKPILTTDSNVKKPPLSQSYKAIQLGIKKACGIKNSINMESV
jgi:hypothetical protein